MVHGHAEALHPLPRHEEGRHVQHAAAPLGGHVVGHVTQHALVRHVTRNLKLVRRQGAFYEYIYLKKTSISNMRCYPLHTWPIEYLIQQRQGNAEDWAIPHLVWHSRWHCEKDVPGSLLIRNTITATVKSPNSPITRLKKSRSPIF